MAIHMRCSLHPKTFLSDQRRSQACSQLWARLRNFLVESLETNNFPLTFHISTFSLTTLNPFFSTFYLLFPFWFLLCPISHNLFFSPFPHLSLFIPTFLLFPFPPSKISTKLSQGGRLPQPAQCAHLLLCLCVWLWISDLHVKLQTCGCFE